MYEYWFKYKENNLDLLLRICGDTEEEAIEKFKNSGVKPEQVYDSVEYILIEMQ